MTEQIDLDQVIKTTHRVITERGPRWVYPRRGSEWRMPSIGQNDAPPEEWSGACRYARQSNPSQPACVVGALLDSLGMLPLVADLKTAIYTWNRHNMTFTKEAETFLTELQFRQDDGSSWGEAFNYALDQGISSQEYPKYAHLKFVGFDVSLREVGS